MAHLESDDDPFVESPSTRTRPQRAPCAHDTLSPTASTSSLASHSHEYASDEYVSDSDSEDDGFPEAGEEDEVEGEEKKQGEDDYLNGPDYGSDASSASSHRSRESSYSAGGGSGSHGRSSRPRGSGADNIGSSNRNNSNPHSSRGSLLFPPRSLSRGPGGGGGGGGSSASSSAQNLFRPPFYGRPPTPLPPSPSLTSLLRPSRPTTPEASDDEHISPSRYRRDYHHRQQSHESSNSNGPPPHDGDHDPEHQHAPDDHGLGYSAAYSHGRRASPRVPTYEYYGFVLYLSSSACFLVYLLWAFLPSPFLHVLGIYYYPNRWWALAIPSFLVACVLYIYVALAGYNMEILTVPVNAVEAIVDAAANIAVVDARGRIRGGGDGRPEGSKKKKSGGGAGSAPVMLDWKRVWGEGTDAVMDIPLAGVCEVLYGEGRAGEATG